MALERRKSWCSLWGERGTQMSENGSLRIFPPWSATYTEDFFRVFGACEWGVKNNMSSCRRGRCQQHRRAQQDLISWSCPLHVR